MAFRKKIIHRLYSEAIEIHNDRNNFKKKDEGLHLNKVWHPALRSASNKEMISTGPQVTLAPNSYQSESSRVLKWSTCVPINIVFLSETSSRYNRVEKETSFHDLIVAKVDVRSWCRNVINSQKTFNRSRLNDIPLWAKTVFFYIYYIWRGVTFSAISECEGGMESFSYLLTPSNVFTHFEMWMWQKKLI